LDWKIKVSDTARKQLIKFERQIQRRILRFLRDRVEKNPYDIGTPLKSNLAGLWRYRVGDYRIICDIQKKILTVLVVRIGHRREVYKK